MSKNAAIDIILRVRPTSQSFKGFKLNHQKSKAQFFLEKNKEEGYINNKLQNKAYQFDQVYDMDTSQEKIFDKVVKDVIDSALDGFNGTIFAYGQTGSGKTYTMTGGTESIDASGIIPRALSYIFGECKQRMAGDIKVTVSYMQIYNQTGYDLMTDDNETCKLEDLRKVHPLEDKNGLLHLKNLHRYVVEDEDQALNKLFIGDTNRVTCKTDKNDQSTRSHCIFIIQLQTKNSNSDVRNVATVHLVDLSGSQRLKTTSPVVDAPFQIRSRDEKQLNQAININLGLHHLERVIVELNKKARGENVHVPYRESLMTLVLRDSIGGNCKTRMIATISAKEEDILESIATCKFAMRVALIKNQIIRNEAVNPLLIIAKLKKQVSELRAELALLKGQGAKDELDKYDIEECQKMVDDYIASEDPQASIVLSDQLKIKECFLHFKNLLKRGGKITVKNVEEDNHVSLQKSYMPQEDGRAADEIKRLKLLLQQRDNELALLVTVINEKKGKLVGVTRSNEEETISQSIMGQKPLMFPTEEETLEQSRANQKNATLVHQDSKSFSSTNPSEKPRQEASNSLSTEDIERMLTNPVNLNSQEMLNEALVFQKFRKSYRKREAMEKNVLLLQEKMIRGKELGKTMTEIRKQIEQLKTKLEKIKLERAVQSLADGKEYEDPREEEIRNQILSLKEKSKPYIEELRNTKAAYETLEIIQKRLTEQLTKDFERWRLQFVARRQNQIKAIDSSLLTSSIKDTEVTKNLQLFLKAQEQIRKR